MTRSILFLLIVAAGRLAALQSVTLAWNPVTNAALAGYNVYYGSKSGTYTNVVSVANVTNATVTGLLEGGTYYFAVTALSTAGLESAYSQEVSYWVPFNGPQILTPYIQVKFSATSVKAAISTSPDLLTWSAARSVTNNVVSASVLMPQQYFKVTVSNQPVKVQIHKSPAP